VIAVRHTRIAEVRKRHELRRDLEALMDAPLNLDGPRLSDGVRFRIREKVRAGIQQQSMWPMNLAARRASRA
jgi:hypothetical protein